MSHETSPRPLLKIRFDPDANVSYGKWECPACGIVFYGGGPAIHTKECALAPEGYAGCTYLFTPVEREKLERGVEPGLAPSGLLRAFRATTTKA